MGVESFILYDGDVVQLSNLNRQLFGVSQVGRNKAEATAEVIREVNPAAEVEVFPVFIQNLEQAREQIGKADVVINTVDYAAPIFLALTDHARERGKHVFFPTNVGWGAVVMVFSPSSLSMADYLEVGRDTSCDLSLFLKRLARDYLPDHLKPLYESFLRDGQSGKWPSIPQIVVGAQLVSALVATLTVKLVSGTRIKVAPEFYAIDAWEQI
jgi:molybdopterin/thiamine biosynthesis adenylyltransferase